MMLLDYFWVLVGFLEKGTKSVNLGNFEVLHRGIGIPCSGTTEREAWASLGYVEVEQSYAVAKASSVV